MKTKILLILFAITSTIVFDSCLKKGEDDPFLSLKSRKARVAGDWGGITKILIQVQLVLAHMKWK